MGKRYLFAKKCIITAFLYFMISSHFVSSAQCDTTFIDFTGNPDTTWSLSSISPNDYCCPSSSINLPGNVNCIDMMITLDPNAEAIEVNAVGAGGSAKVLTECSNEYNIGEFICMQTVGPHFVSLCRSGGSSYDISVTSIPKPSVTSDLVITESCEDTLFVTGLKMNTIQWSTVDNNQSQYLSYLDCTQGCDTVSVSTTDPNPPSYVDYLACGELNSECSQDTICVDTRVHFSSSLQVNSFTPENPVICHHDTVVPVTVEGSGGKGEYEYIWSTNDTGQTVYLPEGKHYVHVFDTTGCAPGYDSVVVTKNNDTTKAFASGPIEICEDETQFSLTGSVEHASNYYWIGNGGTFSPDSTSLEVTYDPALHERNNNSVYIRFVAESPLQHCNNDTAFVNVKVNKTPDVTIDGIIQLCEYSNGYIYSVDNELGNTFYWSVNGGNITAGQNTNEITVDWLSSGIGEVIITQTIDSTGCNSLVSQPIQINPKPTPAINGPTVVCEYTSGINYSVDAESGHSYNWNVTGGNITTGQGTNEITVHWQNSGTGEVSITQTIDTSGCDSTISEVIQINSKPTPEISGLTELCAYSSGVQYNVDSVNGTSYNWNVIGGDITDGQGTHKIFVTWNADTTGKITLTQTIDSSGCDSTVSLPIQINPNPDFFIYGEDTVCEDTKGLMYFTDSLPDMTYQWSVQGGDITDNHDFEIIVEWGTEGSGVIDLVLTNSNTGCQSTENFNVTILPRPTPIISGSKNED